MTKKRKKDLVAHLKKVKASQKTVEASLKYLETKRSRLKEEHSRKKGTLNATQWGIFNLKVQKKETT